MMWLATCEGTVLGASRSGRAGVLDRLEELLGGLDFVVQIASGGILALESDRGKGAGQDGLLARAGLTQNPLRMKRLALPRYVAGQFVRMAAASVVALVFAVLVIDVFDNLKWFNHNPTTKGTPNHTRNESPVSRTARQNKTLKKHTKYNKYNK